MKFVPASGAASRMFKKLEIADKEKLSYEELHSKKNEAEYKAALEFVDNINKFAFFEDLKNEMEKSGKDSEEIIKQKKADEIIHFTINPDGLNYSSLPKGSIKFHKYEDHSRTAFEEQLVEAVNYAKQKNQKAVIHFTVPAEFKNEISEFLQNAKKRFEKNVKIEIYYSVQKPETDTVAVDLENNPFIENDGGILFRPAGHGALLENMNELDADIVFIKNIDNIVPDRLKETTYKYKKLLAGYLMEVRDLSFRYLRSLEHDNISNDEINKIMKFAKSQLNIRPAENLDSKSLPDKRKYLMAKLNRPIRVCGIVENEGHPGGGPFWVEDKNGGHSLQIVEEAQMDLEDEQQKKIVKSSTHFNPVDLVCSLKNYRGEGFDLHKYRDPETGFITNKSKNGRELKALELPGLWNGSMAFWNTIFIEVPKETFTPVKEVNDLLKPEHQN